MDAVIVDTDVFSFLFKGDSRAAGYEKNLAGKHPCLSFMTVAELHRWALAHRWSEARRLSLQQSMRMCVLLPYDPPMAEAWARITVERARVGKPIGCGDCWIAATAVRHGLSLVTHNAQDFSNIEGLQIISHG